MTIYNWFINIFWLIIIFYWVVSSSKTGKVVKREKKWQGLWLPTAFIILLLLQIYVFRFDLIPHITLLEVIGVILCGLGVAFALWARIYLGRNWNAKPSVQEGHELVTSGPYKFVRHPIYTGVMTAILGSVLVDGTLWLIIFVLFGVELIRRISVEEKLMMDLFPTTYPKYMKRTKALVPFIW